MLQKNLRGYYKKIFPKIKIYSSIKVGRMKTDKIMRPLEFVGEVAVDNCFLVI